MLKVISLVYARLSGPHQKLNKMVKESITNPKRRSFMKKLTNKVLSLLTVAALLSSSLSYSAFRAPRKSTQEALASGDATKTDNLTAKEVAEANRIQREIEAQNKNLLKVSENANSTSEQVNDAARKVTDAANKAETYLQQLSNKINPRLALLGATAAVATALAANYMLYGEAGIVGRGIESSGNLISSAKEYVPSWEDVKGGAYSAASAVGSFGKTAASMVIPGAFSRWYYGNNPALQPASQTNVQPTMELSDEISE